MSSFSGVLRSAYHTLTPRVIRSWLPWPRPRRRSRVRSLLTPAARRPLRPRRCDRLVRQIVLPEPDRHRPIATHFHHHPAATLARVHRLLQLVELVLETHHVVVAHHTLPLQRQDRLQPVTWTQAPVCVL